MGFCSHGCQKYAFGLKKDIGTTARRHHLHPAFVSKFLSSWLETLLALIYGLHGNMYLQILLDEVKMPLHCCFSPTFSFCFGWLPESDCCFTILDISCFLYILLWRFWYTFIYITLNVHHPAKLSPRRISYFLIITINTSTITV
jgi:hypothetical protein